MQRLAIAALALSACASGDDLRPRNLEYITDAILAPSCGAAVCHSTFRQEKGYVFDTVAGTRASFQNDPVLLLSIGDVEDTPGLIVNLKYEQPGAARMPYNAPMSDVDIDLIESWLKFGAPGVCNGTALCLGSLAVPCHTVPTVIDPGNGKPIDEAGAYNLAAARDCARDHKICMAGACQ